METGSTMTQIVESTKEPICFGPEHVPSLNRIFRDSGIRKTMHILFVLDILKDNLTNFNKDPIS